MIALVTPIFTPARLREERIDILAGELFGRGHRESVPLVKR